MLTFSPPRGPTLAPSRGSKPRVRRATFGDGYTQRTADGLNTEGESWSLVWTMSVADCDTVDAFLKARAGVEAFLWTPPREGSAKKWLCPQWQRDFIDKTTDRISATFERVYDQG